jgi:hypothetical protein
MLRCASRLGPLSLSTAAYQAPGSLKSKTEANIPALQDAQQSLAAIEMTYPGAVSEACLIDLDTGRELARIVDGEVAPPADLSPDETGATFFKPTSKQPVGVPFQSLPYVSEDTGLWVVATATLVEVDGKPEALVHFEGAFRAFVRPWRRLGASLT